MKHFKLTLPSLLLLGLLQATTGFAAATNSGDNKASVLGDNSSKTVAPADGSNNPSTDKLPKNDVSKPKSSAPENLVPKTIANEKATQNNSNSNNSNSDKKAKTNNSIKSIEDCYAVDGKEKLESLDCNTELNSNNGM